MRFGNERLLSVRPEPRDGQAADPASEVEWMLTGAPAPAAAPTVPAVPGRGQRAASGHLAAPPSVGSVPRPAPAPFGAGRAVGAAARRQ